MAVEPMIQRLLREKTTGFGTLRSGMKNTKTDYRILRDIHLNLPI
jgi:hypothetical protein